MSRWLRFITIESLRFLGLVGLIALVSSLMAQMIGGGTAAEFFQQIHLDRDGLPIRDQFVFACRRSLPILAVAALLLVTAAVIVGAISEVAGLGWVRLAVLAVSAMPSFLLPFLPYLLWPSREFIGLADGGIWIPAICLAIGDCNLSTVASQFRESLRYHRHQHYIQTLEALGRPVWQEIWPRAGVTLLSAMVGRIPHLIGGLVALELLFNINGIGIAAYQAVVTTPADLHWLLWVCILCVCIRTVLRLTELTLRSLLIPETLQDKEAETTLEEDELIGEESLEVDMESGHTGSLPDSREAARVTDLPLRDLSEWLPTVPSTMSPPHPWDAIRRNVAYYLLVRPYHGVNVVLAATIIVTFVALLIGCWCYGKAEHGTGFEDPSQRHWFGTDLAGIDLVSSVRLGFGQLLLPSFAAMIAGMVATPAALFGLHRWLPEGWLRATANMADQVCLYLAEFVESLPKLLVLLAAFSVLSGGVVTYKPLGFTYQINTMVVRLFALIGFLHAPQVYRAVRGEVTALNHSVYIEASLASRMRWHQLLFGTIIRNHCMQVLLIQTAVIAAGVLHYDAVLGLVGVRGRGVIFTWGSTLGMGVEAYMQYGPLEWFNSWVLGVPLVTVWLGILSFWIVAEMGKILWGGYVYRLR